MVIKLIDTAKPKILLITIYTVQVMYIFGLNRPFSIFPKFLFYCSLIFIFCDKDYILWAQSQWAKQCPQGTHWETSLQGLHPLDSYFSQHVRWHPKYRVEQVMNLAVSQHNILQLWIIYKVNWQSGIWRKPLNIEICNNNNNKFYNILFSKNIFHNASNWGNVTPQSQSKNQLISFFTYIFAKKMPVFLPKSAFWQTSKIINGHCVCVDDWLFPVHQKL